MFSIRCAMFIVVFAMCGSGTAKVDINNETLKNIANMIINKLPTNWKVVEEKAGVIPRGHYSGIKYNGPKGLSLVLEGNRDVILRWKDKVGEWHQEALAKESLELWIMPAGYSESWKRFFMMKRPIAAELIFSGKTSKVYGYLSHRVVSDERFNNILSYYASETQWLYSPSNTGVLSWETWKQDIKVILKSVN